MKIYGHPMSTCTRKVLTALVETNTPYELVTIDFAKGEHKQQPHLSRQPFGRVPTLDDNGFTMYESRAMARYVNDKAGGKLVPSDLHARAAMEQWISIETSYFSGPVMKFVLHQMFGRTQEPAALEAAQKDLDVVLAVMDAQLSKNNYFAGADFSIADIVYMPYVEYGLLTPVKDSLAKHANVMAWWNRVSERPSWRKVTGR